MRSRLVRASGPNLRATGVAFDVRRAHPYSIYPELEFDIPTRGVERGGDSLDRYLLRQDEIRQGLRIIERNVRVGRGELDVLGVVQRQQRNRVANPGTNPDDTTTPGGFDDGDSTSDGWHRMKSGT